MMEIMATSESLAKITGECLIMGIFEGEGIRGPAAVIDRAMEGRL